MTKPNSWEYKVDILPFEMEKFEEILEIRGKYNWELCEIARNRYMLFKRPTFRTDI